MMESEHSVLVAFQDSNLCALSGIMLMTLGLRKTKAKAKQVKFDLSSMEM